MMRKVCSRYYHIRNVLTPGVTRTFQWAQKPDHNDFPLLPATKAAKSFPLSDHLLLSQLLSASLSIMLFLSSLCYCFLGPVCILTNQSLGGDLLILKWTDMKEWYHFLLLVYFLLALYFLQQKLRLVIAGGRNSQDFWVKTCEVTPLLINNVNNC